MNPPPVSALDESSVLDEQPTIPSTAIPSKQRTRDDFMDTMFLSTMTLADARFPMRCTQSMKVRPRLARMTRQTAVSGRPRTFPFVALSIHAQNSGLSLVRYIDSR